MILETERIKLIPPAYTYLDKLFEVHHDPLNQKYNPAGPVETVEELKKHYQDGLNIIKTTGLVITC